MNGSDAAHEFLPSGNQSERGEFPQEPGGNDKRLEEEDQEKKWTDDEWASWNAWQ